MYRKFLTLTVTMVLIGFFNIAHAESISNAIAKTGINKSAVSVSVQELNSGKKVYSLNSSRPLPPASTLKLITYSASFDTLGKDFEYKTTMYKSANNDLYIKLSGDPMLTTKDLKTLFNTAKNKKITEPKNIYIDDSVFDNIEWGEGWQWDDALNPLMPKFSAYNLDYNLIDIVLKPTNQGAPVEIFTEVFYPLAFMNLVTTSDRDSIVITKGNKISPEMINVEGFISKRKVLYIPVFNPSRYFKLRTE